MTINFSIGIGDYATGKGSKISDKDKAWILKFFNILVKDFVDPI